MPGTVINTCIISFNLYKYILLFSLNGWANRREKLFARGCVAKLDIKPRSARFQSLCYEMPYESISHVHIFPERLDHPLNSPLSHVRMAALAFINQRAGIQRGLWLILR